ncbi:hypothetical protein [Streptomyces sp. NBC_00035]|uniref:hypothetical protein n=1 Tax=Streptomyces sp. NBC_00035 TaxID=2903614 RepID=UPI00324894A4
MNWAVSLDSTIVRAHRHTAGARQQGARRRAGRPPSDADLVPDSGHAYPADNPAWVAHRLAAFFAAPAA